MRDALRRILKKYTVRVDFNKHRTPTLGRWTIHQNPTVALRKADMTNEDHCGTCDKMRYDFIEQKDVTETIIQKGYYEKVKS